MVILWLLPQELKEPGHLVFTPKLFKEPVQGIQTAYISGGEFEVADTNASPSYVFPLVLDANSTAWGTRSAYIMFQDFGATNMPNLFYFPDYAITEGGIIAAKSAAAGHTRFKNYGWGYAYVYNAF